MNRTALCVFLVLFTPVWIAVMFQVSQLTPVPAEGWRNVTVAHRGGKYSGCENTLDSIVRSAAQGIKHIEVDVQRSLDGVLVVIHNVRVEGISNGTGRIADLTWAELRALELTYLVEEEGGRCNAGRGTIPSLDAVLTLAQELDLFVLLDVKELVHPYALAKDMMAMVEQHGMIDRVLMGSFDPTQLYYARWIEPRLPTVLFTFPKRGGEALCANQYVLPKELPWWLCAMATTLDVGLDWFMNKPFLAQWVGASIVGEHWMGLDVPRSDPSLVYVVNGLEDRQRMRSLGISFMSDCGVANVTCRDDILDPIVRALL